MSKLKVKALEVAKQYDLPNEFYQMTEKKSIIIIHILLSILMYGFYLFLWFVPSIMNNTYYDENKHYVDSAMGVAIVFIFSMPIYLLIHIFFIWYSKKNKFKKILIIHLIGIALLIVQTLTFLFKTNFLN